MEAVIGLLLMLLGVSHGIETYCDGRQDGAQCYGALGGTVIIQLMDSASEIFRYQWFKNKTEILKGGENRKLINLIEDRSSFTPSNGTFRINSPSRTDGGEYTLRTFDRNGRRSEPQTLQLTIQAPVSSVLLVSECLSEGEMRVSCSTEGGDSPQYSWTLDRHTLTDTQILSGNKDSNNITLRQDVSGQLVCSVRNHVSSVSKEANRSNCGFTFFDCTLINGTHMSQWVLAPNYTLCITTTTPTTEGKETHITESNKPSTPSTTEASSTTDDPWYLDLLLLILRATVVVLTLTGIFIYFAWKKKKQEISEGSAVCRQKEHQENSVVMVEVRSSESEL